MFNKFKNENGFTLIEILIALFLLALVFTLASGGLQDQREKLDQSLNQIEQAIRFSTDEAAIRNAVIRIHFFLDKDPQEYAVEYGPDGQFIIPLSTFDRPGTSPSEQEFQAKKTDTINKQFNKIKEFEAKNKKLSDSIKIIALGTLNQDFLIVDGESSFYFYPSGEKDSSFLAVANENEVVSLTTDSFTPEIHREYKTITEDWSSEEELYDKQIAIAKELYELWSKQK